MRRHVLALWELQIQERRPDVTADAIGTEHAYHPDGPLPLMRTGSQMERHLDSFLEGLSSRSIKYRQGEHIGQLLSGDLGVCHRAEHGDNGIIAVYSAVRRICICTAVLTSRR